MQVYKKDDVVIFDRKKYPWDLSGKSSNLKIGTIRRKCADLIFPEKYYAIKVKGKWYLEIVEDIDIKRLATETEALLYS